MGSSLHFSRRRRTRATRAGFTLVELMVAVTGGLFVSIIVFSISKNSARFYQSETRVGEATLGGMVGFERLRNDVQDAAREQPAADKRGAVVHGRARRELGDEVGKRHQRQVGKDRGRAY